MLLENKQRRKLFATLIAAPLLLTITTANAQTAEEKGLEIAREMDRRNEGFVDTTANMKMILRNRAGKELSLIHI